VSDFIYVLLTLGVFILLALLVGVLDRHLGGTPEAQAAVELPAPQADLAAERGAK
jgi:hypothetical protein